MTYSTTVPGDMWYLAPPYSDRCPCCADAIYAAPYATRESGGDVVAFYRHRLCGFQWSCHWNRSVFIDKAA